MKTMVSTAASGQAGAPESPDVLVPGAKAGPWIVERELGRGGMGAVYAVVHEDIGKRAALKVVHKRLLGPSFNSDRMLLEAKVVNQVGHPNIVDIFETGKLSDGRPYIVMERLEGQPLSTRADNGKLLPDLVVGILLQICDALIAAHAAGVVHRDLKLDNVFLVDNPEDPDMPKVKLLDWGIAKLIHTDVKHTVEGQLVGTPQYLSPEQARGQVVTPQSDVYSLGVMAYELFLEQLPFEAETAAEVMAMHLRVPPPPPSELWPDVPPRLQDLLLAMLAKHASARPTSLEVARRLQAVREDFQRRRFGRATPRHRTTATPMDTSRRNRVVSSMAIARTESAAWQSGTKRWQYAVGVLALAASGLLFSISRIGDHTAIAATADTGADVREHRPTGSPAVSGPGSSTTETDQPPQRSTDPRPSSGPLETAAGAPDALGEPAADVATTTESAGIRHVPAVARGELLITRASGLTPVALRSESGAGPARTVPRPSASRTAPARPSSAAPRRGARVDPDGTFDPYL